ncbi:MAG: hypothetical protein R2878_13140 [Thermoleophilia bacterium]
MSVQDLNTRVRRAVARMTERMAPRVPDFHGMLASQSAMMAEGLDALVAFLTSGQVIDADAVRACEKEGDRRQAATLDALARAFAAPFDRGFVILASTAIDDVLNYAKATVREIETLEVPADDWMHALGAELREGGHALHAGFGALRDHPTAAGEAAADVHKRERNAEKIYRAAIAESFDPATYRALLDDPAVAFDRLLLALRQREVYRHLSNTADRLDLAGRTLSSIIVASD